MEINLRFTRITSWIFPILGLYPIIKLNYSTPLLILLFLYIFLKDKPKTTINSSISVLLLTAFLSYFFITLFYSENFTQGINEWLRLLPLSLIPPLIFFWNFSITPNEKRNFIKVFVFSNLVFCFLLLYILGFFDSIQGSLAEEISNRILSDYAKKMVLSESHQLLNWLFVHKAYFSMNIIMALFLVFQLKLYKSIKLIIAIVFIFVVLYSFSVPNVLTLILLSTYVTSKRWKRGTLFEKTALLLVATAIFSVIAYKLKTRDINRAVVFVNGIFEQKNSEGNDPRQAIYSAALEIFRKHPMGVGIGSTQKKLDENYKNRIDNDANMLLFTEELNDDYWFKNNVNVNKNTLFSPNKSNNAEIISAIPSVDEKGFSLSKSIKIDSLGQYTLSAYFKPIDSVIGILRLGDLSKGRLNIDFARNSISYKGSEITNVSLKQEFGGWYRVMMTTVLDSGSHNLLVGLTNTKEGYNMVTSKALKMGVWGVQLNKGKAVLPYSRSTKDLYDYAYRNQLNTHNYFLHTLLIGGPIALILFLIYLCKMGVDFYRSNNTTAIIFLLLIVFNLLSENILFRHSGIFFVAIFMLFSYTHQLHPNKNIYA
jgi:hypothetical protein